MPASSLFGGMDMPSPAASNGNALPFGSAPVHSSDLDDFQFPSNQDSSRFESFSDIFHSPHPTHSMLPGPSPISRHNPGNDENVFGGHLGPESPTANAIGAVSPVIADAGRPIENSAEIMNSDNPDNPRSPGCRLHDAAVDAPDQQLRVDGHDNAEQPNQTDQQNFTPGNGNGATPNLGGASDGDLGEGYADTAGRQNSIATPAVVVGPLSGEGEVPEMAGTGLGAVGVLEGDVKDDAGPRLAAEVGLAGGEGNADASAAAATLENEAPLPVPPPLSATALPIHPAAPIRAKDDSQDMDDVLDEVVKDSLQASLDSMGESI
jgi:hypothetical protein